VTRTHVFIAVLIAALAAGLAVGLAAGGAGAAGDTGTDTTTVATDPGTSSDSTVPANSGSIATDTTPTGSIPTTTSTSTGTSPTTTTIPTTTSAPGTTTSPGTGTTPTTTSEQTTQTSGGGGNGSTTQPTTTSSSPPVAPCDTTQITCGNNAATQVAIVSQNCTAATGPTVITVQVQSLDGKPLDNYTINPTTTCMNLLAITQIVQQFCINCTLIVIPPPPVAPKPKAMRALYCMPSAVVRRDGTTGRMVDLEYGQPYVDPTYAGAVLAPFVRGVGYTCPDDQAADLGPTAPTFTLTVPASFIGQWINLCVQPASPTQKPTCHGVRIDNGATVTIPVTSNVAATVTSDTGVKGAAKTKVKAKSHTQIKKASDAFVGGHKTKKAKSVSKTTSHAKKKGK
jgi:hypothetical protein